MHLAFLLPSTIMSMVAIPLLSTAFTVIFWVPLEARREPFNGLVMVTLGGVVSTPLFGGNVGVGALVGVRVGVKIIVGFN